MMFTPLCSIFVDPGYTRQGIGTGLFTKTCEETQQLGKTHFWLDASLTAVPFYEAMGFTSGSQTVHQFAGFALQAVRMSKQLD